MKHLAFPIVVCLLVAGAWVAGVVFYNDSNHEGDCYREYAASGYPIRWKTEQCQAYVAQGHWEPATKLLTPGAAL